MASEQLELHPDPVINTELKCDYLEGLLADARAGLKRALDYRAVTPEGLAIKRDVRDVLDKIGWQETPPFEEHAAISR